MSSTDNIFEFWWYAYLEYIRSLNKMMDYWTRTKP